jgi:uncharacterized membrane protein YbhN (UPF0104 family)
MVASFGAAALTYYLLTGRKIPYRAILVVQLANGFAGKLLPLGIGGIGLNVLFLESKVRNYTSAAATVTVNNVLGFVGNIVLLMITIVVGREALHWQYHRYDSYVAIGLLIAILVLIVAYHLKLEVRKAFRRYFQLVLAILKHPIVLSEALLSSMILTTCFAAAFWFCSQATGLSISFVESFVIFTFGMAVAAGTPTPGGIGGAEAALTAGLIAAGASPSASLATALLYRLVTYWVPLVLGFAVFESISGQLLPELALIKKKGHNKRHV